MISSKGGVWDFGGDINFLFMVLGLGHKGLGIFIIVVLSHSILLELNIWYWVLVLHLIIWSVLVGIYNKILHLFFMTNYEKPASTCTSIYPMSKFASSLIYFVRCLNICMKSVRCAHEDSLGASIDIHPCMSYR